LFECVQPEKITAAEMTRDGRVWGDDSIEVFIKMGEKNEYRQFIANAAGTLYDGKEKDRKWDSNATAYAAKTGGGWYVIFKIPFQDLSDDQKDNLTPRSGETWKANFVRNRQFFAFSSRSATTWSPTAGNFHEVKCFGTLLFLKPGSAPKFK